MTADFDWVAIYKLGRLATLAMILVFLTWHLYGRANTDFEEPAKRMFDEDDGA